MNMFLEIKNITVTINELIIADFVFSFCSVILYERKNVSQMIIKGAKEPILIHEVYSFLSKKN
jgi:histidyl-tRNA synthetase